jgi:hypothetical protein
MAALSFEFTTTPGTIAGDVNYYELNMGGNYDPKISPLNPEQIHDDQDWEVKLEGLSQSGAIWQSWGGNNFHFRVYFERLGAGEGPGYLEEVFAVVPDDPHTYPDVVITVPAGYLPVGNYELVAELKMIDDDGMSPVSGARKLNIGGGASGEGRILQIINA